MAAWSKLNRFTDFGLLIMRVGLGFMMIMHGYPKIFGGPERWGELGTAMEQFGISYAPEFWGFMAAFAEAGGGLLLILGWFSRPASFLLFITMLVAATKHISAGDGINGASHAIELACVFFALMFIGAGKYSMDKQ